MSVKPDTLVTTQPDSIPTPVPALPDTNYVIKEQPLGKPLIDPIDFIGTGVGNLLVKGATKAIKSLGLKPFVETAKEYLRKEAERLYNWWTENEAEAPEAETNGKKK